MYELFILGELSDNPLHGYLLRDIVNLAIGPVKKMSWGGLYPLIKRLEHEGLIEQVIDKRTSGKRPRKVYAITEAGKERFFFLMLRPEEYTADYPDLFSVKLTNFDRITAEQQLDILRHYQGYLRFVIEQVGASERLITDESHIPEAERVLILRALRRRAYLHEADLTWLEAQLAEQLENSNEQERLSLPPSTFDKNLS